MSKKRGSSRRWLQRHAADPYVQQARQAGYRSRASYKLLEIQARDQLFKPGMVVLDLGAAPGGWSQVAAQAVGPKGRVIAIDLLTMPSLAGVDFIEGDFSSDAVRQQLQTILGDRSIDVCICDVSPNHSGIKQVDQLRAMGLAEEALALVQDHLRSGGDFLLKVFQGVGIDPFRAQLKAQFKQLRVRKPKASQSASRELYLLARDFGEH